MKENKKTLTQPWVLLSVGELPTEPGWYVVRHKDGNLVVEVQQYGPCGPLVAREPGYIGHINIADCTFVARIFPDRMNQSDFLGMSTSGALNMEH